MVRTVLAVSPSKFFLQSVYEPGLAITQVSVISAVTEVVLNTGRKWFTKRYLASSSRVISTERYTE